MIVGSSNLKICLGTLSTFFLASWHFLAFLTQFTPKVLEKSQLLALVPSKVLKDTTMKKGLQNSSF